MAPGARFPNRHQLRLPEIGQVARNARLRYVEDCQSCRLWPGRNDSGSPTTYAAPVSVPVYDAPAASSGGCGPGCTSCGGPQTVPSLQVAVPGYTPVLGQ